MLSQTQKELIINGYKPYKVIFDAKAMYSEYKIHGNFTEKTFDGMQYSLDIEITNLLHIYYDFHSMIGFKLHTGFECLYESECYNEPYDKFVDDIIIFKELILPKYL